MIEIRIGFKAFDMHELLCHFAAKHAGLYDQAGLRVRLCDTTFLSEDALPPETFSVACAGALMEWLQGMPKKVVFVACERPMFWLYARPHGGGLNAMHGARVAGYPAVAPPAVFLQAVLQAAGPGRGVWDVVPARDDVARLGLLLAGDVDAAVLSSAVPPARAEELGLKELLFFGDRLHIPTTGLAVHRGLLESRPELVAEVTRVFRRGLDLLRGSRDLLDQLLGYFPGMPVRLRAADRARLLRCFCTDGTTREPVNQAAITLMRDILKPSGPPPAEPLYDFASFRG